MGRCYEFGVEIHPGCQKTMVVSAQGGSCECADCGAHCPGRFAGCAQVVAVPRRVPTSSPDWARPGATQPPPPAWQAPERSSGAGPRMPGTPRPRPQQPAGLRQRPLPAALATNGHRGADAAPDRAAAPAGLEEVGEMLSSQARPADEGRGGTSGTGGALVEAIAALTTQLLDLDERLAAAFLVSSQHQAELGAQVQRLTVTVEGLAAGGLRKAPTLPAALRQVLARKP